MYNFIQDPVVQEDIQNIVHAKSIEWEKFRGKAIAVTGATGVVGKMIVMALLEADKVYDLQLNILAFVRNLQKAETIYGDKGKENLRFVVQDITDKVKEDVSADYLVHGASVTASKMMVENPVETILTAIEGTKNIMDFASRCKMDGVVYLSSMEVYGIVDAQQEEVREENLGYINPLNVRSSYSEGKRMTECLCVSYAKEYGVPVKIARLAQTFGAGIDKTENRVFAQFAREVQAKGDIVLHTKGEKANCYCYTSDAVAGILTLLTKGETAEAYNVANMDTFCSVKEMADTFIKVSNNGVSKVIFDIPEDISKFGYAPSSIMRLNSEKMMALGWNPSVNMENMIKRLMDSLEYSKRMEG